MTRAARRLARERCLLGVTLLVASVTATLGVHGFAAGFPVSSADLTITARSASVPAQTCSLVATADTSIDEQNSLSNYGFATDLRVGAKTGQRKRTLVAFDLTPCAIPTAVAVKSATLRMTIGTPPPSTRTYDIYRLTSAFNEFALTWSSTQPPSAAGPTSSVPTGASAGATVEWDVTTDVETAVTSSPTSCGWMARDSAESGGTSSQSTFRSREHPSESQRPTLDITYYP